MRVGRGRRRRRRHHCGRAHVQRLLEERRVVRDGQGVRVPETRGACRKLRISFSFRSFRALVLFRLVTPETTGNRTANTRNIPFCPRSPKSRCHDRNRRSMSIRCPFTNRSNDTYNRCKHTTTVRFRPQSSYIEINSKSRNGSIFSRHKSVLKT